MLTLGGFLKGAVWFRVTILKYFLTATHFGFVRHFITRATTFTGRRGPPPLRIYQCQTVLQWGFQSRFLGLCVFLLLSVRGAHWQRAAVCPWSPRKKWQFYGGKRIPGPFITQSQPRLALPHLLSFRFYLAEEHPLSRRLVFGPLPIIPVLC